MSSVTSHIIPKEGLRTFRYYYFVRQLGKEVMLTIFKYNFLEGTTKTIFEILNDAGVNLGKKSRFNSEEIRKLASNVPPESLDITALFKICQVLWEKNYSDPGDSLKGLLKAIKDERNKVSHEEGSISENELITNLGAFRSTLETSLREAETLFSHKGAKFDSLKIKIDDTIPKIQEKVREKYDPSSPDDLKRFQNELEEFKDHLHEYIQEKSKEELRDIYSDLCRILPFDWLSQYGVTDPSDIMVPLMMEMEKQFHPSIANQDPITLDQEELLNFKDPSKKDPKVVILTGNAGSGKTTVLSSIVEKWYKNANDMPGLSSFQTLLYMQFRSHDYDNFEDYLRDRLQRTVSYFNIDLVKASLVHSKCLILCDGYDESNSKSKKLFESLLRLTCKEMKVVITSRPFNAKELSSFINQKKLLRVNLNILGVSRENMESHIKYVTNYLISDDIERNKMIGEITEALKVMNYEINQILKNPLWLNLFILLCSECPDKWKEISTVTALYMNLKENSKERLVDKLEIEEDKATEFDKFYKEWSFRYHLQKKYELSQEDTKVFQRKCKELDLNFDSVMSSYFNIKYTKKGLNLVKVFCYKHKSEQEFVAATVICDTITKFYYDNKSTMKKQEKTRKNIIHEALISAGYMAEIQKHLEQTNNDPNFEDDTNEDKFLLGLMIFISGILHNTGEEDLLYVIIDDILDLHWKLEGASYGNYIGDIDIMIEHCVETKNDHHIINAVIRKLSSIYSGTIDRLNCCKPQCLSSLPQLLLAIKPTVSELSLVYFGFLDELQYLNSTLDTASQNGIEISLDFFSSCAKNTDKYIDKAKTCVTFRGRLTEDGVNAIPTCIRSLEIKAELNAIKILSVRLSDFKELNNLQLHLNDDGSGDIKGLNSFSFKEGVIVLNLVTDYSVENDPVVQRIAHMVNTIWQQGKKDCGYNALSIRTKLSKFIITGSAIRRLGELLTVKAINTISIFGATLDSYEAERELCEFYKDQGIGTLQFLGPFDPW